MAGWGIGLKCGFRRTSAERTMAAGVPTFVCGIVMRTPSLDPDVADSAPSDAALTSYDEQHLVTYWRLLDAEADGADWKEVARIVLHIDPDREPARARNVFDSHLTRAKWMADHGYRDLLRGGATE